MGQKRNNLMSDEKEATAIQNLSSRYGDLTVIRALIQAIPYAGGSLDTLLCESGQKFKLKRIESFLNYLDQRLQKVETLTNVDEIERDEYLYDLIMFGLEHSARTKSEEKKRRFAKVIANQIIKPIHWDRADTIMRLISQLSEVHIYILKTILEVPICDGVFGGLKVICLKKQKSFAGDQTTVYPTNISPLFPELDEATIRLHLSELISMGLIKDEGVGRLGTRALDYFIATEITESLFTSFIDE